MLRPLLAALSLLWVAPELRADATIALPFANTTRERSFDWIGESIAENVLDALYGEGLIVLDRQDRAAAYQRLSLQPTMSLSRASIVKIASELDASHAVYGSFTVTKPKNEPGAKATIRIVGRVLDLRKLMHSDEIVEEGLLEDLAVLQNKVAWQALRSLAVRNEAESIAFLERRPKIRVDAMESYIRGLIATDGTTRHRFFTQANRLDPKFSQPSFQLGLHYWEREEYQLAADWFQKVSERDAHFSEALFYSGICRHYLGEYAKAEAAFTRVAAAVPLNEVYSNLGLSQLRQGRVDSAIPNLERALEGDTADPDYHFNLGYALWYARRFDEAVERFRATLERIPNDTEATSLLGFCLKKQPPRPGDPKYEGRERMKEDFEESAFRQLQSMLQKKE